MHVTSDAGRQSAIEENALIRRASAGNTNAFADLLAPRLDRLLRSARAILINDADARDVAQETCVSAWVNLPRLRDEARFDAWLNRVLLNRCRDVLRARQRSHEIVLDGIDLPDLRPSADVDATAGVMAAFDRLSLADRNILVMHHLHDQPLADVARVLGIPVGTAKSRLHAARRSLERALRTQA